MAITPEVSFVTENNLSETYTPSGPVDGTENLTLYFIKANVAEGQEDRFDYGDIIAANRPADNGDNVPENPENPYYEPLTFSETMYYPVDGSYIRMWGFSPKPDTYEAGDRAEASWTFTGKEDIMIARAQSGNNTNDANNPLQFQFEHVLTQLQFYVHTESSLAAASWGNVTEISLSNQSDSWEFYFEDGDDPRYYDLELSEFIDETSRFRGGPATFAIENSVAIQQITEEEIEAKPENERSAYFFGSLMIEQQIDPTPLSVNIKTLNGTEELTATVTLNESRTYLAGQATRVYLNFMPGEITATLRTGNWETVTVDDVVLGEYPYVQRGYIVISKDLLGESSDPIHENWAETPRHGESEENNYSNSVSASFEIATEDVECTWNEATNKCKALGTNWRVPTERETELILMLSDKITQTGYTKPFKNGTGYWSATESNDTKAVYVEWNSESNTSLSEYGEKTETHKLRCIRDI